MSAKKQKNPTPPVQDDDLRPKSSGSNLWLGLLAAAMAVVVLFSILPRGSRDSAMSAASSVIRDTAQSRDIPGYLYASGTLKNGSAQTVEFPEGITVTDTAVQNGQSVRAGDMIARVDKISVLTAISRVQSMLQELDSELSQLRDEDDTQTVTAQTAGRVKQIFSSEGSRVSDIMYDHGALMILSLGGSMSVTLESGIRVEVGQPLTVTLSQGQTVDGKVQQYRNGTLTLTLSDDGPQAGEPVSVALPDGTMLGTGVLEISSPLKITGYAGAVADIAVEEGEWVEPGDTLLTLEDTNREGRSRQLLAQRDTLIGQLQQLTRIAGDGGIRAAEDGIVIGLDEALDYLPLSAADGYAFIPLSNTETDPTLPPVQATLCAGVVTKVAYSALELRICELDVTGMTATMLALMPDTLFTLTRTCAPALDVPVWIHTQTEALPGTLDQIAEGDRLLLTLEGERITQIDVLPGEKTEETQPEQYPSIPDSFIQFPTGGFESYLPNYSEPEGEEVSYVLENTSLCTLISADTVTVDFSVDERDILALIPGQIVQVTLDALPGQHFEGKLRSLNPQGSNLGGSTKYTVTLELPRTQQMLEGMNASVFVELDRLEQVLTVPAAAVHEDGSRIYVYTGYDEASDALLEPVTVTTGASDGSYIQILSGLTAGDPVCYRFADTITYDNVP